MKQKRTRTNQIKVYFNDEEYAELLKQVEENNISISKRFNITKCRIKRGEK